MLYNKPPLSIADQVTLLESRGLIIDNHNRAEHYLANISYYRLSAYMLPFKEHGVDQFKPDITFSTILNTYLFDRELRLLVFDAIERIEIAFRTQAIYQPAIAKGPFWYENSSCYLDKNAVPDYLARIDQDFERSKETFIQHFKSRYSEQGRPPAWMMFEVLSFGLISLMCLNLNDYTVRNSIAAHFGFPGTQRTIFESWLQSMVYVRNICAHHSRLWNRKLTYKPGRLQKTSFSWIDGKNVTNAKMYYFLCVTRFLLARVNPESGFVDRLKDLVGKYPQLPIAEMDFPAEWQDDPFWN